MLEQLSAISTYRSLWSLCSVNKAGKMKVVYYAACLVFGRAPLWGVWDVNGRFRHFSPGREAIGDMHPNLSWRRVMARWSLADENDAKAEARRQKLSVEYNQPLPGEEQKQLTARKEMLIAVDATLH